MPDTTDLDHLLSFVTDENGSMVTIHADLAGVDRLILELQHIRERLIDNDCSHAHLFSQAAAGDALTATKLDEQPAEVHVVHHVKIYGWNDEWSLTHGLRK